MSPSPVLAPGQRTQIYAGGPSLDEPELLFETADLHLSSPNWTLDGRHLLLNGDGLLWALDLSEPSAGVVQVEFEGLPELNNDHVLARDGDHIFLSANDRHIYHARVSGGPVIRVTPDDGRWHLLHGVSPDGARLAYVEIVEFGQPGLVAIVAAAGGEPAHLDTGDGHADGPEWSADGAWIYFNTEQFTLEPGHAQLARTPDGGGAVEQLSPSDRVDWFPHPSPDGAFASYVSFPSGTIGLAADVHVEVCVVSVDDWSTALQRYPVFGGQGTHNVNSWSPDSSRFAFVAYPIG